jgi:hypothetical protein
VGDVNVDLAGYIYTSVHVVFFLSVPAFSKIELHLLTIGSCKLHALHQTPQSNMVRTIYIINAIMQFAIMVCVIRIVLEICGLVQCDVYFSLKMRKPVPGEAWG